MGTQNVAFIPEAIPSETSPSLEQTTGEPWTPLFSHSCSFPPEIFTQVMLNLIRNPNINSNHLFRADISLDCPFSDDLPASSLQPRIAHFKKFTLKSLLIRTMIPRNMLVDKPLDETCASYEKVEKCGEVNSLVTYLPHIATASGAPFYYPAVHGIGFLHSFHPTTQAGRISIYYLFFDAMPRSVKLERTAQHLLAALYKHGQGTAAGYVKRVHHDSVLPQAVVQNTYSRLKAKYARTLCQAWVEDTDPGKHVFEDLGIAAFLIELWADSYKDGEPPGFVDIGCGNGLLVHILLEEGYSGWGFDARRRKSWLTYSAKAQENLKEMILIPSIIQQLGQVNSAASRSRLRVPIASQSSATTNDAARENDSMDDGHASQGTPEVGVHNGIFPDGTFIISNHADELTPWTPILANISKSPFMMIPCCSHALSGARFRAPPPKEAGASSSAYASLVAWVSKVAKDCGWEVEKEMLRIPSTRNTALIGRRRYLAFEDVGVPELLESNGGAVGWEENALKLINITTKGH